MKEPLDELYRLCWSIFTIAAATLLAVCYLIAAYLRDRDSTKEVVSDILR